MINSRKRLVKYSLSPITLAYEARNLLSAFGSHTSFIFSASHLLCVSLRAQGNAVSRLSAIWIRNRININELWMDRRTALGPSVQQWGRKCCTICVAPERKGIQHFKKNTKRSIFSDQTIDWWIIRREQRRGQKKRDFAGLFVDIQSYVNKHACWHSCCYWGR